MKRFKHNIYLIHAFVTLALIGNLSACVEYQGPNSGYGTNGVLSVKGTVSEATVVTRAGTTESDVNLKEKYLNTLDVFVEHVTVTEGVSNGGDGTIMKQYHLVTTQTDQITEELNKLADHWASEGLVIGEKYNIYVATNNPLTTTTITTVEALKALTYDEVTYGIAVINQDNNNITWGTTTTSGNIYKLYNANPGNARALTDDKKFMMDGVIKNWTPDPTTMDQVFDVTLNRAAAKFFLNVKFDNTFLQSLSADGVNITGSPAWKFYNFAFGAPVFTPEDQGTGVEVHSSDFNIFHNQSYTGDDKHFQIITYSYPNQWDSSDNAPSLVISVMYSDSDIPHYYRIPLVKNSVTKIERNHIYVINATIATRGSELHEDVDEIKDVIYEVLPWNDQTNSDFIENNVESVQHYYFRANPKVYTLRGDGDQSVIINYSKATGTKVGWQLFAINPTTGVKGEAVESTESSAVWGWFYDKNGAMKTTLSSDGSGIDWSHMGVTISQTSEGTTLSNGKITVTSTALNNRAIKYILLRVYLNEPSTFSNGKPTLYEDILIRHFPTDNIQSIDGLWSSYSGGSTSIREYSWDPVADGWEAGSYLSELVDVETGEGTPADYIAGNAKRVSFSERLEMDDGQWDQNYNWIDYRDDIWTYYVPQGNRQSANSEANAYGPVEGGYYLWGEGSVNSRWYSDDYDWIQGNGNNRYYRYRYFYFSRYVKVEKRTRYYRDVEQPGGTGNWVDWERDAGKTGTAKYDSRGDDPTCENDSYHAHYFSNGTVHYLNSTYNNNASVGESYGLTYSNNHMYVVQISSTSSNYVLGKPVLGNPDQYRSQDDVVSPAFMIASQLGIVTNRGWDSVTAAEHCGRYMEVGIDGTRYIGWRLPTADEIEIISNYQGGKFGDITIPLNDRVMDNVLKGSHYYNLSGGTTPSGYSGANQGNFLRCVRDLSDEEIERLNGFDKIIERYRNQ